MHTTTTAPTAPRAPAYLACPRAPSTWADALTQARDSRAVAAIRRADNAIDAATFAGAGLLLVLDEAWSSLSTLADELADEADVGPDAPLSPDAVLLEWLARGCRDELDEARCAS